MLAEERIELLLASSPDRQTAARFLRRLQADSPSEFDRIAHSAAVLRAAIAIFSYSAFLSESVLRDPERIVKVATSNRFYRVLTVDEYEQMLEASDMTFAGFRRRQWRLIALGEVPGVGTLAEVTRKLSHPPAAILDVAYRRVCGP